MPVAEQYRARFDSLMQEYDALDKSQNPAKAASLLQEAGSFVDREAEPEKWAAFRSLYAQYSETADPVRAIEAYRDALTVWDSVKHYDSWVACHSGIGSLMVNLEPFGPKELDEAVMHLESAVEAQPFLSSTLAVLYRFRSTGDPRENWRKRVHHLRQALLLIERDKAPGSWAAANNELAIAIGDEPDADFGPVLEERLRLHLESFSLLEGNDGDTWIDTCIYLSECYLFRGGIDDLENQGQAERYARLALDAAGEDVPGSVRAEALLNLAKVLMAPGRIFDAERVRNCLSCCDESAALIDPVRSPALMASVESFRANALLKLIQNGEPGDEERLAAHAEAALALLPGAEHTSARRSIMQVAGEGMLVAGHYERAAGYFRQALDSAESALLFAESREGRMQRIWEFRDTSALLSWSLLKLGDKENSLFELEKGKSRFWRTDDESLSVAAIRSIVPRGGALLVANFSCREGAVIVVTAERIEVVWLPSFGKDRLMELQRGGLDIAALGGWIRAYHMRNSEHEEWRKMIEATGETLYRELWEPVLDLLQDMGIAVDAELIWFPQGGSGVFPVHAAWRQDSDGSKRWLIDRYTVRYAPDFRVLLSGESGVGHSSGSLLLVANPCGDLDFSELECAWVMQFHTGRELKLLHGTDATPDAVLDAIGHAGIVHFSTHAVFDLNRPLCSSLLLAGGEPLALERLIPALEQKAPGLVVLSACETAMSRISSTPDEFLGFPAAFLHSGAGTVLATLWPVDDAATALLAGRFYREFTANNQPPARALRAAQNWIRSVTALELMELMREMKSAPPPAGPFAGRIRTSLRKFDPEFKPFASPYYWAAFTISGKE
ncbi:MAG: CHAT domain-containing protein [Chlorobium sp.]|uniref:CHAT domain-containing protein n=1 Tax=Chlorobium sp. TaxID=1095 RepID=UPI0025B9A5C2|nr:CHAT domain-containing protein [Chlorobium sp.]MCF8382261.1 CHAT domain-containing protein [Chlorobium sp.]